MEARVSYQTACNGSTPDFSLRLSPDVFSARQSMFALIVFPLLGELPMAVESHLPVCQLCHWQLGSNMCSPTTMSSNPIVVTVLQIDFQGESIGPATCGFACNCMVPEAGDN